MVSEETLDNTRWRLISYQRVGALSAPPDGAEVTLEFAGERVGGRSGCNRYAAQLELGATTIHISNAVATRMMCLPPLMELEQAYLAALHAARGWERDGESLTLRDDSGAALLVFQAAS